MSCKDKEIVNPVDQITKPNCTFSSFSIDDVPCHFDKTTNTFYYSINKNTTELKGKINVLGSSIKIYINQEEVDNFSPYTFKDINVNQSVYLLFILCDGTELNYLLKFTNLPIIHLQFGDLFIFNEPKQAVPFRLHDPDYLAHGLEHPVFSSTIGIETRGGSAQIYPKKSYGLELWTDDSGSESFDASLLGMRNDDDWILDAMFIDKAKMRNRVSTDIWQDMTSLHYQVEEPTAQFGIKGKPVEVFVNDRYHGLYFFSERMDRKTLQLKKSEENEIKGLLYKASFWGEKIVKFETYFPSDPSADFWDGWEQKHPDPDDFIHWEPLDEFTDFVVNADNDYFNDEIGEKLLLDNVIDYFILLNLIRGDDNTGKNIYMARYKKSSKFFMVPWDMDATWGRDYLSLQTSTQDTLSNRLFNRLIENNTDNFRAQLKQRWFALRGDILRTENLKTYFEKYATTYQINNAFQRDAIRWERSDKISEEIIYINNWMDERLLFLDDFYLNL